jgi:ceramide kinase
LAQGPEPGAQAPQLAQQLFDDGLGLPTSARHARGGATHRRTSSIVASLRIGHIPAGSTDAAACTLNGTRSAFTAAMHVALGDACPLDVLRVDMGE